MKSQLRILSSTALLISAQIIAWSAQAASFDCSKVATKVEKLICSHTNLSKLDDELHDVYQQLLAKSSDQTQIVITQRRWLKTVRNPCDSLRCVNSAYQNRIHSLKQILAKVSSTSRLRGKFVLAYDLPKVEGDYMPDLPAGGVCQAFTDNLNEFRQLQFDTCNPRISPKFARFSRPTWQEIPLNLDLAKKMIKIQHGWYEGWLKETKAERAAGDIKMWQLSADFFGNGKLETMVRLDHARTGYPKPSCSYYDSQQMLVDLPKSVAEVYSKPLLLLTSVLGNDLIYDSKTSRYYILEASRDGPPHGAGEESLIPNYDHTPTVYPGSNGGMIVYLPTTRRVFPICWIDWVPAQQVRVQSMGSYAKRGA